MNQAGGRGASLTARILAGGRGCGACGQPPPCLPTRPTALLRRAHPPVADSLDVCVAYLWLNRAFWLMVIRSYVTDSWFTKEALRAVLR